MDTLTNVDARVIFDVEIPATADYPVTFRYANGNQETKNLNLYVNGAFAKTINFTSVGGNWNEWQNYTENLALQKGRNEISLRMDNGNTIHQYRQSGNQSEGWSQSHKKPLGQWRL